MTSVAFSVVIPALNEETMIGECISHVRQMEPGVEIIVADGGSMDGTVDRAMAGGAIVCRSAGRRGIQCNEGAALASGDVLVFLHADTRLPPAAIAALERAFEDGRVQLGTCRISFDPPHWFLSLFCLLSRFDPGIFRFGDQCIVVRKPFFMSLNGFALFSLFEDMDFVLRARKRTTVRRFDVTVKSSSRRFFRNGVIRQQMRNVYYTALFMLGVPPGKLARKYYGSSGSGRTDTPADPGVSAAGRTGEAALLRERS